ncbi:hypothetical protein Pla22_52400 [Rubripirellula amarantea]|uniref:Uncharacterized protein n=1 Tax=Rubripirellula amarantea TaxID=2527999 RepID=A0A5C5WCN0_9BACT|nr:hypothetical protein [Rubripirellula amarantea]TWT47873.1 hypothetical protein Pla22_52400 [Rubripirellula amarantea]
MVPDFTKSEKRFVRQVANLAWDRLLRKSLVRIASALGRMDAGTATAFDVDDAIHKYHAGPSRQLHNEFSTNKPWHSVCNAYIDGILTDDDFVDAPDGIRKELAQIFSIHCKINGIDPATLANADG